MNVKLKDGRIFPIENGSVIALDDNGETIEVNVEDIESIVEETIDWEHRRYEIAKESIAAIMSNSDFYEQVLCINAEKNKRYIPTIISEAAVAFSDALIKELKNKKK